MAIHIASRFPPRTPTVLRNSKRGHDYRKREKKRERERGSERSRKKRGIDQREVDKEKWKKGREGDINLLIWDKPRQNKTNKIFNR